MPTVKDVLTIAKSYVGLTEYPPNSNNVVFNTRYYGREVSGDAYKWCCAYVWAVFTEAGMNIKKTATCTELGKWFKDNGRWIEPGNQKPGDVVFYKFNSNNRWTNHVGIVDEVVEKNDIYAIEGNTSEKGSQDNGGAVLRKHRKANIVGYGRMDFESKECKNGIDISRYQTGIDLAKVPCDFVIVKATQGTNYISPAFAIQIKQAESLGKLIGVYHYAGGGGAIPEANHFLEVVKDYIGKAILFLDWEGKDNPNFGNPEYAKAFLAYVEQQTGITPFIYMSKSVCRQYSWDSSYPLWCAQYKKAQVPSGYQADPWTDDKGYGAWKSCAIFQYSSVGQLPGYNKELDLDLSYISAEEWEGYAKGNIDTTPKAEPLPTLKKGDKNEYVRNWQVFLNLNGYPCGLADGIFGTKTDAAVRKWQKDHGLEVDGIIGKNTWASLPMEV